MPRPAAPADTALKAYRNLHAGETIVVCGCGSSLAGFRSPEGVITIGVNDVGRQFDPDYLVVVNPRNQFAGDRFRYVETSRAKALFTQLDLGIRHPHVVRFRLGRRGGFDWTEGDVLHYTRNSPYVALQLALYMGARRIGMLGVDFTNHHFFAATGRHPLTASLASINAEYSRVHNLCLAREIEVRNLSPASALTAFPKQTLEEFLGCRPLITPPAAPVENQPAIQRKPMYLAIEKHKPGIVGDFFDALAETALALGHSVARSTALSSSHRDAVAIVWNGRNFRTAGRALYCEHAWLPRWEYQISPGGINADSHLAPFRWDGKPLTAEQLASLEAHLESVRAGGPPQFTYMQTAAPPAEMPSDFLLVPFQMEWDTNILRHVPVRFRRMQALVDYVSAANPPFPIIFKQHPADVRRGSAQLRLRLQRRQDAIWPHNRGNIHQMLKSGKCRGIVALNSNVVHDGLLWDVPAVVLGNNIWARKGRTPFLTDVPKLWSDLDKQVRDAETIACRQAYAYYLMSNQWKLADARDRDKVEALLAAAGEEPAHRVRSAAPRATVSSRRARINVSAVNLGWLFEDLKRQFVRQGTARGIDVVATDRPTRHADAWIFIRTKEAAAAPVPARTLVQIHDMFDNGLYRPGGQRSAIRRCAGLTLTHPAQQSILERNGVSLTDKLVVCRPIGALESFHVRASMPQEFTVAWVGRPEGFQQRELKRVDWFVDAVRRMGGKVRAVLLGDRLDAACAELRRAGIACAYHRRDQNPIDNYPRHYAGFDALVITSSSEAGPLCLFEALATGVPVVSTRVGWAPQLISNGENGFLVDTVEEIAQALNEIRDSRSAWFERREPIRNSSGGYTLEGWVNDCLTATQRLL